MPRSHGGFDDDSATMTSVLLRILRSTSVAPGNEYAPNLPAESAQVGLGDIATSVADRPPELVTVDVRAMGGAPRMITGEPTETRTESAMQPEPAVPGSGNRPSTRCCGPAVGSGAEPRAVWTRTTRRSRKQAKPYLTGFRTRIPSAPTELRCLSVSAPRSRRTDNNLSLVERGEGRSNSRGRIVALERRSCPLACGPRHAPSTA